MSSPYLNAATMQSPGMYIKKYAKGGLNTKTGLAWLDGTPQKPERILSPYQTELFENMLASLHEIRVKAPTVPGASFAQIDPVHTFHIDTIQIQVEKLEGDADYEEMARKVGEHIYEEMTRGAPVGGLRYGR